MFFQVFYFFVAFYQPTYMQQSYEQARLQSQHDAQWATRRALAARRDQLWRQIESLKQAGDGLSAEFCAVQDQLRALRSNKPRDHQQISRLVSRRNEIMAEQAKLKELRQHLHDEIAKIKSRIHRFY
jgi:chromosome segregation ATPase